MAVECEQLGGEALSVPTDVTDENQVNHLAARAIRRFGRIDAWVNNAGVSIYGRALDVSIDDMRRLFETNFWGVVYGSRVACEQLRRRGGALINLGSEVSDKAVPLQGIYSASKHAVKGWTDALRTLHPDENMYTFWDYFRQHWPRDAGLRIDHLLTNAAVTLRRAGVDRWVRGEARASDHAPAWIEIVAPDAVAIPATAPADRAAARPRGARRRGAK